MLPAEALSFQRRAGPDPVTVIVVEVELVVEAVIEVGVEDHP